MPHISPVLTSVIGLTIFALLTGATLLATRIAERLPQARPILRPLVSATVLFALGGALSGLQLAFPFLDGQPYENLLMIAWLSLSSMVDLCFLWFARNRRESGGLLLILGSTAFPLVWFIPPRLPPHPPFFALGLAWCVIVMVFYLPHRLLRRRLSRLYPPRPAKQPEAATEQDLRLAALYALTPKQALGFETLYALTTSLLAAFIYFKERALLASLPGAFTWAGAVFGVYLLLDLLMAQAGAIHARGGFQRWLAPAQDRAEPPGEREVGEARSHA